MQRSFFQRHRQPEGHTNGAKDRAYDQATSNGEPVNLKLDALIIGAGFGGVYLLHLLRKAGYNAKIVEAGSGLGGVWHWSNYPGARVDSQYPVYQLAIPEVYTSFEWTERFPGVKELQRYFQHVDKVLDISKDTLYHTRVTAAKWDDERREWNVECENGTSVTTNFLHCCLGVAAKRYIPEWPGLDDFSGSVCHSSFWPENGIQFKNKRVGVVGQGATGIQIAQTCARECAALTVFIRTPNLALPMSQGPVDKEQAKRDQEHLPYLLHEKRFKCGSGFLFEENDNKSVLEETPEQRVERLEEACRLGGFRPLFSYNDIITNREANRWMYDWWSKRTRARISNPEKRDILAPVEPLHAFLGKRCSLEQDYYEQMDKDHVELVDLKKTPISHVVPKGVVTSDGKVHELDILALATGFDSLTGSFNQIKIEGVNGQDLEKKWSTEQGALSYLGLAIAGFPNMFYTYGPHAPTAYVNGPSTIEPQAQWIVKVMDRMRKDGKTRIIAKESYEQTWKAKTNKLHETTLWHETDSWYMGTNIPGKQRQALNYAGPLPEYIECIQGALDRNFEGFELS